MADKETELKDLIEELRSKDRDVMLEALATLREYGWLYDGTLGEANLNEANLNEANLNGANLVGVDLNKANLRGTELWGANLSKANLSEAALNGANLNGANLSEAVLNGANLSGADLSSAYMRVAYIFQVSPTRRPDYDNTRRTDLSGANLNKANLSGTNLSETNLKQAIFTDSFCVDTIFLDVDLSTAIGLETIQHRGPSYIDTQTLFKNPKLPEVFLRGCGVSESLITYLPSLREEAIVFYSCFISYSHADQEFAKRLYDRLQGEGIRCWLDEHQLNPGDPLHPTIYEAIRVYDKVLLCCSETAIKSWWVEKELKRTMNKEENYKASLVIPLNLDGYVFTDECTGWVADEVKQRLAADFTRWKDHDQFERAVKKVIKALRTDGGNLPPPPPKVGK